jgi:F0F1-type ATP synthase assembly protein I
MDEQDRKDWIRGLALLAWISGEVLGLTTAGLLLGYFLHRCIGISQVWMVVPGALGLAAAFWRISKATGALGAADKKKQDKS